MSNFLEVEDSHELFRRLAPLQVKEDGTVSSSAFKFNKKPLKDTSVDLAHLTNAVESVNRVSRPGFQLGSLVAKVPRTCGRDVLHDPVEGNYSHAIIAGQLEKQDCYLLAEATTVISGVVSQ